MDHEASSFVPPPLTLELQPRSGPIVIKIDYIIGQRHLDAVLECMREQRRVQN
ncbi:hypothetical protein GOC60_34195 [Sinorhizobium meliloti]|nr:hypothetical protein [Sinorhizobium meliloti]MDX0353433.1 hypothetical protein [Sinorhizobium meliloti]